MRTDLEEPHLGVLDRALQRDGGAVITVVGLDDLRRLLVLAVRTVTCPVADLNAPGGRVAQHVGFGIWLHYTPPGAFTDLCVVELDAAAYRAVGLQRPLACERETGEDPSRVGDIVRQGGGDIVDGDSVDILTMVVAGWLSTLLSWLRRQVRHPGFENARGECDRVVP